MKSGIRAVRLDVVREGLKICVRCQCGVDG